MIGSEQLPFGLHTLLHPSNRFRRLRLVIQACCVVKTDRLLQGIDTGVADNRPFCNNGKELSAVLSSLHVLDAFDFYELGYRTRLDGCHFIKGDIVTYMVRILSSRDPPSLRPQHLSQNSVEPWTFCRRHLSVGFGLRLHSFFTSSRQPSRVHPQRGRRPPAEGSRYRTPRSRPCPSTRRRHPCSGRSCP